VVLAGWIRPGHGRKAPDAEISIEGGRNVDAEQALVDERHDGRERLRQPE